MQQKNMIDYPVEQTECTYNGNVERIKNSSLFLYKEFMDNQIYNSKVYNLVLDHPVNYTSVSNTNNNVFSFDSSYELVLEANNYNAKGKLLEFKTKGGLRKSFLYHGNGLLPIASAINASANEIYYNGFEESTLPTISLNSKYGRKSNNGVYVMPGNVISAGSYTKTWWEQIAGVWEFKAVPIVHNGWDNIVFGSGNLIDNLSVYPQTAQLESYDYDLAQGIISKVTTNGEGVQFGYDSMLRLKQVLNRNGDILKSFDYNYKLR